MYGFAEGKGISNAFEKENDQYTCCVDYTEAIYKMKRDEVIKMLEYIRIYVEILRIILKKLFIWTQVATIKVGK